MHAAITPGTALLHLRASLTKQNSGPGNVTVDRRALQYALDQYDELERNVYEFLACPCRKHAGDLRHEFYDHV